MPLTDRPPRRSAPVANGASVMLAQDPRRRAALAWTTRRAGAGQQVRLPGLHLYRSWDGFLSKLFAQLRQGVAIARGGGIGGDFEGRADLDKREAAPDFQDEHLTLLVRQA